MKESPWAGGSKQKDLNPEAVYNLLIMDWVADTHKHCGNLSNKDATMVVTAATYELVYLSITSLCGGDKMKEADLLTDITLQVARKLRDD